MQRYVLGSLVVAAVLAAPSSWAQGRDPAGAEVLYRAGRDAARKGDWATACSKLAESQRLDPAAGTLLNLADCEEHRGQLATAWQHFVQAQGMLPKTDARAAFAEKRIAAVERRVPKLVVHLAPGSPTGVRVTRDDQELGAASFGMALPVDPGEHAVVTRLEGHADARASVTVAEGETREIVVAPGGPGAAGAAAAASVGPAPAPSSAASSAGGAGQPAAVGAQSAPTDAAPAPLEPSKDKRTTLGWVGVGVGGAAFAVGAVAGVLALDRASTVKTKCGADYATCDTSAVDAAQQGKTFTVVSTVGILAGTAIAAAGVYFLVTSSPSKTVGVRVSPTGGSVEGVF